MQKKGNNPPNVGFLNLQVGVELRITYYSSKLIFFMGNLFGGRVKKERYAPPPHQKLINFELRSKSFSNQIKLRETTIIILKEFGGFSHLVYLVYF